MKRANTIIITMAAVLVTGFLMLVLLVNANKTTFNKDEYNVTIIHVESGDTLWNIANNYKADDCSVRDYIMAVRELNNMNSKSLQANSDIMVYIEK